MTKHHRGDKSWNCISTRWLLMVIITLGKSGCSAFQACGLFSFPSDQLFLKKFIAFFQCAIFRKQFIQRQVWIFKIANYSFKQSLMEGNPQSTSHKNIRIWVLHAPGKESKQMSPFSPPWKANLEAPSLYHQCHAPRSRMGWPCLCGKLHPKMLISNIISIIWRSAQTGPMMPLDNRTTVSWFTSVRASPVPASLFPAWFGMHLSFWPRDGSRKRLNRRGRWEGAEVEGRVWCLTRLALNPASPFQSLWTWGNKWTFPSLDFPISKMGIVRPTSPSQGQGHRQWQSKRLTQQTEATQKSSRPNPWVPRRVLIQTPAPAVDLWPGHLVS